MLEAKKLAPVVLFTYNRPDHTKRTIEALAANELADQTELFVFSDAPKAKKDESEAAEKAWKKIHDILIYGTGGRSVKVYYKGQRGEGIFPDPSGGAYGKLRTGKKCHRGCDRDRQSVWQSDRVRR